MAIIIERQAPERGVRGVDAAPAGGCCCCCCCCLHTVGGAIGALSALSPTLDAAGQAELPRSAIGGKDLTPRYSAAGLYWAMVAMVSGLVCAGFFSSVNTSSGFGQSLTVIALVLPAIQLGASVAAAIVIACSKRVGTEVRLRHLGKITLRAFVGAVIGGLVLLPLLSQC